MSKNKSVDLEITEKLGVTEKELEAYALAVCEFESFVVGFKLAVLQSQLLIEETTQAIANKR